MTQKPSAMERELARQAKANRQQAEVNGQQAELLEQQTETIQQQHDHIEKLKVDLDLLRRYIYGRRRERFVDDPANQPMLFDLGEAAASEETEDADDDEEDDSPSKKRRKGHGRRKLPDHLPHKDIHHILEGDELLCPCCGKVRVKISEEVSEQLEFVPASLFVMLRGRRRRSPRRRAAELRPYPHRRGPRLAGRCLAGDRRRQITHSRPLANDPAEVAVSRGAPKKW